MQTRKLTIDISEGSPRSALIGSFPSLVFGDNYKFRVEATDGTNPVALDADKQYVFGIGLTNRPTGGKYILSYGDESTQALGVSATAEAVENALNALSSVKSAGGVKVGGNTGGPFKIYWCEAGERSAVGVKNILYPDAQIYSSLITAGDNATCAVQAMAFRLRLLSAMSNMTLKDVSWTTSTTTYVEVEKPVTITTKTTTKDESGNDVVTETTETRTEKTTEPQTTTQQHTAKAALEFDLSLATIEALMALGGAARLSVWAELAEVSSSGVVSTLMQTDGAMLSNVIPDAATLVNASQELTQFTAMAKFYAIGTKDAAPTITEDGAAPSENDKGSAAYYAQLAANAKKSAGESATSAAENAAAASDAASAAASAAGSAASAASSAESAKTAAESAQTAAQSAATQAASDKTTTETYKNAAESAKNAAELAKTQAQEISDPENRIGNLQILKQNCGQLYLNGGYGFTNCKPTFGAAQSLLFTYEVSESELDAVPWSIIGNVHIWSGQKGIGFAKNTSNKIQCGFNWSGNTTERAFIEANTTTFADGKPHAWALICGKTETNGFFKLYRDGVLIDSKMSLALFDDFIPDNGFYFGKGQTSGAQDSSAKGRLSRVAFFNFDVSASDALYSLVDYQSGKSIPPTLNLMAQDVLTLKESDVSALTQNTYNLGDLTLSAVWEDGYLAWKAGNTATITAEQAGKALNMSLVYALSSAIPQGAQVEVSFDDWAFNTELFNQSSISANPVNQRYYGWFTLGTAKNSAIANTENIGHGETLESQNFTFTSTVKADKLYILPYNFTLKSSAEQEIAAGTVFAKIKGLKVKVNGTALNLESYTIARNTTTRLIKDLSAGGYDATITGNIAGDMDRQIEVFVDEIKTQIAQSTATA